MNFKQLFVVCPILFIAATVAWADDPTAPPKFDPASVERGKQNFASTCGFCHGVTGKGGEKGPDLLRSVLVLDDDGGKSIGPVILKGRQEKGMPKFPLSPDQIKDIANFLHSSIESTKDRDSYKILNIVTGDAAAGKTYFDAQCAQCHSITADLKGIGAKYDPVKLQTRMVQPEPAEFPYSITVTLPSGESVSGKPMYLDDFTVSLRQADGTYRSFKREKDSPKVEVHNKLQGHLDLLSRYTDDDIHNLTAYLVTVK